MAAVDVLGFLPCPPSRPNHSASSFLEGQILAYAAHSAVVIVDIHQLQIATVLSGLHRSPVTAVSWCPERQGKQSKLASPLRLASGDADGRVVVWSVQSGTALTGLEDAWQAAGGRRGGTSRPPVSALAWLASNPALLVIAYHGLLLIWDPQGGGVVWKRELGAEFAGCSIQADPSDCRRFCLCGKTGSIMLLHLLNPLRDKVGQQTYRVGFTAKKPLDAVRCVFAAVPDLLYILLPHEIVVFDLEYGQPAASTPLPPSLPSLSAILGCYGHAAVGLHPSRPGIDTLFCCHQDGSISMWDKKAGELAYSLAWIHSLIPPASRVNSNHILSLVHCHALPWLPCTPLQHQDLNEGRVSGQEGELPISQGWDAKWMGSSDRPGKSVSSSTKAQEQEGQAAVKQSLETASLLVVAVTDDGQIWQWDLALRPTTPARVAPQPASARFSTQPKSSKLCLSEPSPQLLGVLQNLPHSATTLAAHPAPITIQSGDADEEADTVGLLAAVTSSGNVEVVSVQRGLLMPLQPLVSISLGAHKDRVRGVKWLGSTSRVLTFSTEKLPNGWRNTLLLTDVRNRASVSFRDVPQDSAPLLGIRTSPSGIHVLLLLKAQPSEIWQIGKQGRAVRVRLLDLPFTAVEWVLPSQTVGPLETMSQPKRSFWQRSPLAKSASLSGYSWEGSGEPAPSEADTEEEELLAFSLADGRVGVLGVRARKVRDMKAKRPNYVNGPGGGGESIPTALAGWGHLVLLGNDDGLISRWDTRSGRTTSIATHQGTVRRIHLSAQPSSELGGTQSAKPAHLRIAVLFHSGMFAVFELDSDNELRPTPLTVGTTAKLGKIAELAWLALPNPIGSGTVLACATEAGSLTFVDSISSTEQPSQRQRLATFRGLLNGALPGQAQISIPGSAPFGSSLLMPRAWVLLLSLLMQCNVSPTLLRKACSQTQAPSNDEQELLQSLPEGVRDAWDSTSSRMSLSEVKDLCHLAMDREVRQVIRRRSDAVDQNRDAAWSEELSVSDSRRDAVMSSTLSQASDDTDRPPSTAGEPLSLDVGQPGPQPLRASSRSRGPLKRHMSKLRAGANALRGSAQGSDRDSSDSFGGRLRAIRISEEPEAHQPAPLTSLLATMAGMRANGNLLYESEWAAYASAYASGSVAERMSTAAEILGFSDEAAFWKSLPPTLLALRKSLPESFSQPSPNLVLYTDPQTGISAYQRKNEDTDNSSQKSANDAKNLSPANARVERCLWSKERQHAEAKERAMWHEKIPHSVYTDSEPLQERRVMEHVALGDNHTAVGFLLASAPEQTSRFYRNALNTYALAAASKEAYHSSTPGVPEPVSKTLQIQVAKVVTAHAASVGDHLLGVPLLCSAGLPLEAAGVMQDCGLWRYAATLSAKLLQREEQAVVLERWANHIYQAEGDLWRALGVLTAAGALKSVVLLLRECGLPDKAAAFVEAAVSAGFGSHSGTSETGGLENWNHAANAVSRTKSFASESLAKVSLADDFRAHCTYVLQHL